MATRKLLNILRLFYPFRSVFNILRYAVIESSSVSKHGKGERIETFPCMLVSPRRGGDLNSRALASNRSRIYRLGRARLPRHKLLIGKDYENLTVCEFLLINKRTLHRTLDETECSVSTIS